MNFLDTLKELRNGAILGEAESATRDLVAMVRATGKPGSLTLTLTVRPASKGDGNTLLVTDDLKLKTPRAERGSTVFFATADDGLSRRDPRQPELPHTRPVAVHPSSNQPTGSTAGSKE